MAATFNRLVTSYNINKQELQRLSRRKKSALQRPLSLSAYFIIAQMQEKSCIFLKR
ncbi:hypothetical protein LP420_08885 [Massilia sp. B-10]|nr:hypothetical protein LP420_08885 [Massilia sp. B-10]UUZ55591.1 hypothetical protein LP419_08340 [Massilia sp. H-1]